MLGIKKQKRPFAQKMWSEEERNQLKELLEVHTELEIAKIMNRTTGSVRGQKGLLGLKSARGWEAEDISRLRTLVSQNKTNKEIAKIMGRTRSSIQQSKAKIGLGDYSVRKWTKKEEASLRKLAAEMTTAQLAEYFGREWTAVNDKCHSLGIRTQSKRVVMLGPFTKEDDTYIIDHSWYMTNLQLAEKLKRTVGSIKQRKTRLKKRGFPVATYIAHRKYLKSGNKNNE